MAKKEKKEIKEEVEINGKVELYKDSNQKFRFRVVAKNNQIVAVGQSYISKQGCKAGINSLGNIMKNYELVDIIK